MRLAPILALLAALAAGCDEADPEPDAFFVATVSDASGAAVAGAEVYVVYGDAEPYRDDARQRRLALEVSGPFPNPTTSQTLLVFGLSEPQAVRVRLLDVTGAVVETLTDQEFPAGQHAQSIDLSGQTAGYYVLDIDAGGETVAQPVLKTAAPGDGLAIFLGRTDASGRLAVDDRTRFPSLYAPDPVVITDDQGNQLSTLTLTAAVEVVALGDSGQRARKATVIREEGASVSLRFAP